MPDGKAKKLSAANEGDELTGHLSSMASPQPSSADSVDRRRADVRGALEFRLLMLLDKAAEAQALSRIVGAGLLVVDDRITIPANDSQASDDSVDDDPFMKLLTEYIVAPIGQPGSASQMAPLVARVQMPEGVRIDDLIKLVELHDPNQTADWHERIKATITRIAIGLDMPPEEFLGLAQANHWTGWVITEEKWKSHGEPVTIRLCEDSPRPTSARLASRQGGGRRGAHRLVRSGPGRRTSGSWQGRSGRYELGEFPGAVRKATTTSPRTMRLPTKSVRSSARRRSARRSARTTRPRRMPGPGPTSRGRADSERRPNGQPSPMTQQMSSSVAPPRSPSPAAARWPGARSSQADVLRGMLQGHGAVPKVELAAALGHDIVSGML